MWTLTNSAKLIEKIQNMRSVVTWNTAPSNPSAWDLWYDTTSTVKALKMYDWTSWVIVWPELVSLTQAEYDALPAAEKSNGKFYLITDASGSISIAWSQITWAPISSWSSAPSNPNEWDIWYDTTNDVLKAYDGTNWNEVGSDAADINTKTFYIRGDGSAEDLQRAQAAWDWILAWKNALLIDYDKRVYTLTQSTSSYAMFYCDRWWITYYNSNAMIDGSYYIRFSLSSWAVTSIGWWGWYSVNVLQTDVDYSTPYTPLYNGSPATKQYVDNKSAAASWATTTQPSSPSAWAIYYDTTNNVLKVYNWTTWETVWWGSAASAISTTQPSNPSAWSTYFDTTTGLMMMYDWSAWEPIGNVLWITQTAYDNLPSAQKNDGKLRIITDAPTLDIVDDTAFGASWDWDTDTAPSKNAVYDAIWNIETLLAAI